MQIKKPVVMKPENKELLIFLLVTFGLAFLMGIPLEILSNIGKDTYCFALTQMFYPTTV